jgi:hypothetical protein
MEVEGNVLEYKFSPQKLLLPNETMLTFWYTTKESTLINGT